MDNARSFLRDLFQAAVDRAQPALAMSAHLPSPPAGRTIVIGAGKASARMAVALDQAWGGPLSGLVVTSYGNAVPCSCIRIAEASHPVPDEAGEAAATEMLALVSDLGPDDLVIALISGGGSSLLPAPLAPLTLLDEQAINRALLASGAPIGAMNVIRSQFSTIKNGRLAMLCHPARVATLVLSDVPGDDPRQVSSGPTIPSGDNRTEASALVDLYDIELPTAAKAILASGLGTAPHPADPAFSRDTVSIIASAGLALEAAAEEARRQGITPIILSDSIEGEARHIASMHGAMAREVASRGRPFQRPVVLLSGGETTVTLRGKGRGGRNSEFALALALSVDGLGNVAALAADTDGIDGSGDNAGAYVDGNTADRLRRQGINPLQLLVGNDAYAAFSSLDDLLITGPTGTNVNDFRAVLIT
ncbi:MAG: glycerate kinase type-2 family protein [Devosia sp.]